MRSRILSPRFFINNDLCKLPPETRLLFEGLWCLADRDGRLEDRPEQIRVQILPYDKCLDINLMLGQLHDKGFIQRYTFQERGFIQINSWKKYGKPHAHEPSLQLPCPCELPRSTDIVGSATDNSLFLFPYLSLFPSPKTIATDKPSPLSETGKSSEDGTPAIFPNGNGHDTSAVTARFGDRSMSPQKGETPLPAVKTAQTETLPPAAKRPRKPPADTSANKRPKRSVAQKATTDTPEADTAAKEKRRAEHSAMFDVLIEFTHADAKVSGGFVGRVAKALLDAEYTPDDLRRFFTDLPRLLPWVKGVPSVALVQKHIGVLRAPAPESPFDRARKRAEQRMASK